jgi:hypothetical protein
MEKAEDERLRGSGAKNKIELRMKVSVFDSSCLLN